MLHTGSHCLGGLDFKFGHDRARAFEGQRQRHSLACLERLFQIHQHDVETARLERHFAACGHVQPVFQLAHPHHPALHGHGVDLDPSGDRRAATRDAVGGGAIVGDGHESAACVLAHSGLSRPRLGYRDDAGGGLSGDGGFGSGIAGGDDNRARQQGRGKERAGHAEISSHVEWWRALLWRGAAKAAG